METINWINGVSSIVVIVAIIANLFITFASRRAIEEIHRATNSMKDALVRASEDKGFRAGRIAGRRDRAAGSTTRGKGHG